MNSLFSLYWSKTGILLIFLSIIKAMIMFLNPSNLGKAFFIQFPLITLLDSLFILTIFMKIHPRGQNFWRKLLMGWFLMIGIYLMFLLVCSLIIGLLYLISMAFQKPMNESGFMIFVWISLMIVAAAVYLLNHFYFSGIYVFYERFVLEDKNRHSTRTFTAPL